MNIRWRLAALTVQLVLLGGIAYNVTGEIVSAAPWFFAGLLAVVVNPQLLEPWYARPQDVIVNSVLALGLFATTSKVITGPGWIALVVFLVLVGISALLALVLGAGREEGTGVALARSAHSISRIGSAAVIYSAVFWLSVIELYPSFGNEFWTLGTGWAVIMLIGAINWQTVWAAATRAPLPCVPDGMVGPSVLRLSATSLPAPGALVRVKSRDAEAEGIMITRIQRAADAWGEVFIAEGDCRSLVRAPALTIEDTGDREHDIVGAVDAGSTDRTLRFVTPAPLRIGQVVSVAQGESEVLYQISFAEVDRSDVRGGSRLIVRARANQLGQYDPQTGRIDRHQWVPEPGKAVRRPGPVALPSTIPETWVQIGKVLGTEIPVYMDLAALTEGHLTILGMTRMGKTSFAAQIANALGRLFSVMILDQTGEYVRKRGFSAFSEGMEDSAGTSVFEPKPGDLPAKRALDCLNWLVEKASNEYKDGEPHKRVVILEEAHQFVPEPAGLGFQAPGRDEAYKFGLLMMQIRKYGLSVILISQRTAVVAKSALSQCENLIAFKSVDQTGLDYLEALMGDEARSLLPTLQQGQALAFGPAMSLDSPVVIDVLPPGRIVLRTAVDQEDEIGPPNESVEADELA